MIICLKIKKLYPLSSLNLLKINYMKKLNKKYADLLRQASVATGRKEAINLLHQAAKLQTKFEENSKL